MRFSIGEEVFLVSEDDPSLNCEAVVEDIIFDRLIYRIGVIGPNGLDLWEESALRKKYKPSSMSFEELMKIGGKVLE